MYIYIYIYDTYDRLIPIYIYIYIYVLGVGLVLHPQHAVLVLQRLRARHHEAVPGEREILHTATSWKQLQRLQMC